MRSALVRRGATLLSAGLMLALLPAATSAAAPPGPSGAPPAETPAQTRTPAGAPGASRTVTLVTGDKVTVTELGGGKRTVSVDRPRGATGAVRTRSADGEITVVPDEALPYLRSGRLDRRLFDVSALIRQGLTDDRTDELPLIVTYGKGARAALPAAAEATRSLPSVRGTAVEADKGRAFWRSVTRQAGVAKVWLDARVTADMAQSNAQIGTEAAWNAGLTGKGVTVAVLDTGADLTHPDLAGRVAVSRSFVEGQEVADRNGHGTHVASTVGGSGAASDGAEKGVAPGATLAVGKVLSDQGSGSESQIIAGMEWAARDVHAKVISMSLGSTEPSDGTDPMAESVNTLSAETGALFVIAARQHRHPAVDRLARLRRRRADRRRRRLRRPGRLVHQRRPPATATTPSSPICPRPASASSPPAPRSRRAAGRTPPWTARRWRPRMSRAWPRSSPSSIPTGPAPS
ncbi:hypothetical protein GCM10020256_53450 [Streptomyces thermocoprophilus]